MSTDRILAEYERKLSHIRDRRDLNGQARTIAIARAYQDAQAKMAQAQQDATAQYQRDRTRLERQLFGSSTDLTGSDAINQRAAREMAAKLDDPNEALLAYQRAKRDGDTAYQRAIASHAADLASIPFIGGAWQGVVDQYTQDEPGRADAYKELTSLRQPGMGTDFTYVLPEPTELGRLTAGQVLALADSDLEVHGDAPTAA